ncbi:MAG: hypothetical protein E7049_06875 [Lentisphaerae bacterium]|nr:hypothetical protein [Lentisphaerota bacterium]
MTDKTNAVKKVVQIERLGLNDFLIALLIGAGVFVWQTVWEYPGLQPECWNDIAVALGIYPASSPVPGYWTSLAGWIYSVVGITAGHVLMRTIGHIVLAVITMFVYAMLREILAFIMQTRPQRSKNRSNVMRLAAAVGAVSFAACDPIWVAGQFFSETTLLLLLTVLAVQFFFTFLRKGELKYSYVCALFLGLLTAESPIGGFLLVSFIALNFVVLNLMPSLESPFFKPELIEVGKWHMTFIFLGAFLFGVGFNVVEFIMHDGLVPIDGTFGDIPLKYLMGYVARLTGAATPAAWVLLLGISLLPFVVSIVRFPEAADEERFLTYTTGIVFLVCGIVTFTQCASLPALWFWTYVPVKSHFLLSLTSLMFVLSIATSLTILGVDGVCRDHKRLSKMLFGADDDADVDSTSSKLTIAMRHWGMVLIPLLLLAALIPGRRKAETRDMLKFVDDVVKATVDECNGAKRIFTDGNLDTLLEIEAKRQGKPIICSALVGGGPHPVWLRSRGTENDPEDKLSFEFDSAMGLRSWIRDKPEKLKDVAVQMAFDLWKRDGKPIPPIGGMVSLPTVDDEPARLKAVEVAHELCQRALDIYARGIKNCTDELLKSKFFDCEWRLSRMCVYRAERFDLARDAKSAIAEMDLSKKLNDANETFKSLVKSMGKRREQIMTRMTPREGLQLALVRADFNMAKLYAESVLGADPENPDANFAMGMYYQKERQLARAEEYLMRCLIRNPNEPAIYNNLAMLQMELGKLDAASVNVEKALKLLPESAAILDTKLAIERAAEAAKEAK